MTWRLALALLTIGIVAFTWTQTGELGRPAPAVVAPARAIAAPRFADRVSYGGRWEIVARGGNLPGRVSARSFHTGDSITIVYRGEGVRLFGITGPQGGGGVVVLPGFPPVNVNFYASKRALRRLVYVSPALAAGVHSLSIVVAPRSSAKYGRRGYVNIDGIEVAGDPG